MKKIISVVLAVVFACSMLGVTAFAERLPGDVNSDGNITAVDARKILQVVAGLETGVDATLYDVDGNGSVSAVDARIVLQIVAGLIEIPGVEDKPLDTKAEQLDYFVKSFNDVKTNAATATHKYNKIYNYNNHVYIHPVVEGMYNMTLEPGDPSIKEVVTADFSDELIVVDETYVGENIATAFPPVENACNLKLSDVSNISFVESGEYYIVEMTVKGKMNPTRNESVGNVATIVTKEDFETDMSPEDLEKMSIDCDYKDAVVKAKIEKTTGNMVEYSVDCPMIMIMNMTGLGKAVEIGMGFYEEWTVTY